MRSFAATYDASGGTRVLLALLGALSVIVGLWAVRHVLLTLLALVLLPFGLPAHGPRSLISS